MDSLIQRVVRDDGGQDLVEYAFLIVFIALAIISVLSTFRTSFETLFADVGSAAAAS